MGITLYTFNPSPPCRAVRLLARELELDLELKETNIFKGENKTPEFLAVNPQHSIPTLNDNGFILWERVAINQYLANKYGKDDSLYPKDPQKRAVVEHRLLFDNNTLFKTIVEYVAPVLLQGGDQLSLAKRQSMDDAVALLDKFIEQSGGWVAGPNRTIADYNMIASFANIIEMQGPYGVDLSGYKNVLAWVDRCKAEMKDYDKLVSESAAEWGDVFRKKTAGKEIK